MRPPPESDHLIFTLLWWSLVRDSAVLVGLWSLRSMVRCFQARSFHFMTRSFHSFSVRLDVKAKCSIFFFSTNVEFFYLFIYFASWLKERGIQSGNTKAFTREISFD